MTPDGTAFEEALLERGFIRPSGPGVLTRGVHHPILQCGVEVVGNAPFDGRVSASNLRILIFRTGNLRLVSAEDVIADRMGQFASDPTSRRDMLQQAIMVYKFAHQLDEEYLSERIRAETSNVFDLPYLQAQALAHEDNDD